METRNLYNLRRGINKSSPKKPYLGTKLVLKLNGIVLFLALVFSFSSLVASQLPTGFAETRLTSGLDPVDLQIAPDGRVFVTEKNGGIRIIKNGSLLSVPFMQLTVDNFNERGLMGLAFDPEFATNQYIYVYYTVSGAEHNRVSRFKANGDVVLAGSEKVLIDMDKLSAGNHNGGALFFKGGKLFITTGDGGNSANSPLFSSLLGKVLRINPDGSIPADNPFVSTTTGKYQAIWALGLRNPFKATVQPGTGRIFINDVGQNAWEEVNEGFAGKNYGWPGIEGNRVQQSKPANYQDPLFSYGRTDGCSITASAFYNPVTNQFPTAYVGKYFYADYCGGYIKMLDVASGAVTSFATGVDRPLDVKVASDGSVYYIARGGDGNTQEDNTSSNEGTIWRVQYTGSELPTISANPSNRTVPVGGSATFRVSASGSGTLSYQWQRNGVSIVGANAASYTISNVALSDNGASFRCIVSNLLGSATSASAILTVTSNKAPTASFTSPVTDWLYRGGDVIAYSATATDPEDGNLPASAFTWKIDFHHDTHMHPAMEATTGAASGSFEVPRVGETASTVWYRIYLTVTDSQGQTYTTYRDVQPAKATITLASNPVGLQLKLDGQTVVTPYAFTGVVGMNRTIEAVSPQVANGSTYQFASWSDGGLASHNVTTPAANTTYQASFSTPAGPLNGLNYAYYEGAWEQIPDYASLTPVKTGVSDGFSLAPRDKDDYFAFRFTGYLQLNAAGTYTFFTASDDGSQLYVDNVLVVENGGVHPLKEKKGSVELTAGRHTIEVVFFERAREAVLNVSYEGPGVAKQLIPATLLFTEPEDTGQTDAMNGAYYLVAKHSLKVLDILDGSSDDSALLGQRVYDGTRSQIWNIAALGNGYYKVINEKSAKSLEVAGIANGDDLYQYPYTGKENQQWKVVVLEGGYFALEAKNSGKVMEITSSSLASGALAQQWNFQGKDTQKWKLQKVDAATRVGISDETKASGVALLLTPNPATDKVTVTCKSATAGKADVLVTDSIAGVRISRSVELQAGSNAFDLNVSGLVNGVYFVKVVHQGKAVTSKVLIVK